MLAVEVEPKIEKTPPAPRPWALEKLPPFPAVATRLIQVLANEDANISEVGKIIAAEPVFATRVLQMANSPLFALQRQIKTIAAAIVLLGLERIKVITMVRAVGDFVGPVLKIEPLRRCWQHSLAGAMLAEKLARACQTDPDVAYLAALLRDIGRLALLVKFPGPYGNLLAVSAENSFDLMTTERDLFDVDHCQAGAWLVADMHFPAELCRVVARHHETPSGPFDLVQLVRVADMMSDALGFGVLPASLGGGTPSVPGPAWDEALSQLPDVSRARFQHKPEQLTAELTTKIQSWK